MTDFPTPFEPSSFLVDETKTMERARRQLEQQGHRALLQIRVLEQDHALDELSMRAGDELDYSSDLQHHPLLDGQQFDGIESNPPDPSLSPAAKEKYKEAQRKQKAEKELKLSLNPTYQNRLTNTPSFTPRFNPKPGGP